MNVDNRLVLRRSSAIRRKGSDQVLARAFIDMDPDTLLPLYAVSEQGGVTTTLVYDWENFIVRRSPSSTEGKEHDEIRLDF